MSDVSSTIILFLWLGETQQRCCRKQPYGKRETVPDGIDFGSAASCLPESWAEFEAEVTVVGVLLWMPLEKLDDVGEDPLLPFSNLSWELFRCVGIGGSGGAGGAWNHFICHNRHRISNIPVTKRKNTAVLNVIFQSTNQECELLL